MDVPETAERIADRLSGVSLPEHVAIVMDGNGRWAQQRGQPRHAGHYAGVQAVRGVIEVCARLQVRALTLFAFSSENWRRPKAEVRVLMELFRTTLDRELAELKRNNIRLRFIGERGRLEKGLQQRLTLAEEETAANDALTLVVATSYGGRWELSEATRRLASAAVRGELDPAQIDEAALRSALCAPDIPDPDLFIRTGGEQRLSNFLLWQLAYTELYFTETLWPDFTPDELAVALEDFAERERRFGELGSKQGAGEQQLAAVPLGQARDA
ncbi:di-trans,poly-cis-decaprenylcistransferase [Halorhodospira abdelmalekii]|uniref:polyprenyl diphosphate synthase n=1 Tax=Halorhodospira abdelmalekii TaxID=421629 RepID=UPI001904926D|nr:polyprenyl diphosphate synthase [Halorhodospira abdelmalekii]MBK1735089.1 di-trans,poly-cis-decaprenylcistransferase [Halorhodospira abdelmalekii]